MFIVKLEHFINEKNKDILKSNFWDKWIGKNEFSNSYLSELLEHDKNLNFTYSWLLLCKDLSYKRNSIVGIMVYKKFKYTNIYEISLLAKKKNSKYKNIGKKFTRYLKKYFNNKIIILIDDSEIPNYYEKLGYKKLYGSEKKEYKLLLNTSKNNIYIMKISRNI
tara:strand:- start:479 stop:970 length:492 start_codon:yes stop_codon:yes gene_type:complete